MYSNNTEEDKELVLSIFPFNSKNDAFLNDMERMKYFIDRFNQYYNEETYENHNSDSIDSSYIHEIMMAITIIKQYLGL